MAQTQAPGGNSGDRPNGQAGVGSGVADKKVRYAVVGLGHIVQVAVLPAFAHAENSELVALVSNDETKLERLGKKYAVPYCLKYEDYDEFLARGEVDAIYIGLPNHLHCDYTVRAARAGVHVLCEKPLAVTEEECELMMRSAQQHGVQLMVAYRLHFERANLEAVEVLRRGELGDVRLFESVFSQVVKAGDIRLNSLARGGGSVYDMGVYCINAARYLFRDEPLEVVAFSARGEDPRYAECDEMTSAILRFPNQRIATFTSSFGAAAVSTYRVVGTQGTLTMEPAYEYAMPLSYTVDTPLLQRSAHFEKRDQFAPELLHFSECVLSGRSPEPDGAEGLADVRIIRAIYESARSGSRIQLEPVEQPQRPTIQQAIDRPGIQKPDEVRVSGPSGR
jgi:predicted dehydrogenase